MHFVTGKFWAFGFADCRFDRSALAITEDIDINGITYLHESDGSANLTATVSYLLAIYCNNDIARFYPRLFSWRADLDLGDHGTVLTVQVKGFDKFWG